MRLDEMTRMIHEWMYRLRITLRGIFRRSAVDREVDEELRFHLDRAAQRHIDAGAEPGEAMRRARMELGGIEQVKSVVRDGWRLRTADDLAHDIRYSVRSLRRRIAFTVVAIATIGIGVGASTSIFSVIKTVVLQTLPFANVDRLAIVWHRDLKTDRDRITLSQPAYDAYVRLARSFDAFAAVRGVSLSVTSGDLPTAVDAVRVTPNIFDALGIAPAMGRTFVSRSGDSADRRAAMISYEYWQRVYGGDSSILGRDVTLRAAANGDDHVAEIDGRYTIVGVLPPRTSLPYRNGDIWLPLSLETPTPGIGLLVFGRLRRGVTVSAASAELAGIHQQLPGTATDAERVESPWVSPLRDEDVGDIAPTLNLLAVASGLLLIIVSANVGNMLLGRMSERRRELDVRRALGATRFRLIRQLVTESAILSLGGAVVGTAIAWIVTRTLAHYGPDSVPRLGLVGVDGWAVSAAIATAAIMVLLFGIGPALAASRDMAGSLRVRDGSSGHGQMRRWFVASEVALAFVVLTSTGMVITSARALTRLDIGYDPTHALTFRVALPAASYPAPSQRSAFFFALLDRLRAMPGVKAAGATSILPQMNTNSNIAFALEDGANDRTMPLNVRFRLASPGYIDAIGARMLTGRDFSSTDLTQGAVLISASMKERYFGRVDPIGRRLSLILRDSSRTPLLSIVGVVSDVRQWIVSPPQPTLYWLNVAQPALAFAVRSEGDPKTLITSVQSVVHALDAEQPISDVRTQLDRVELSQQYEYARFRALLMAAFGLVAIFLACLGIYGVMQWSVVQRTREFGVRMALGATRWGIIRMVVVESMRSIVGGAIVGLLASVAVTRYIASVLVGAPGAGVLTIAGVAALLAASACLAAIGPASRAGGLDPMLALRAD